MLVDDWIRTGLAFIYPEICQVCKEQAAAPDDGYVCVQCLSKVTPIGTSICDRCGSSFKGRFVGEFICGDCHTEPPHYTHARSACVLKDALQVLIHHNKYNQCQWMEPLFARLMKNAVSIYREKLAMEVVLAVPLFHAKQRERSYNQSTWLAKAAAEELGMTISDDILKRVKPTETQTRLSRRDRKQNMKGAFGICRKANVANKSFLLVDDVMTTGATIDACANTLIEAGAKSVCTLTLARGIRQPFLTCELPS